MSIRMQGHQGFLKNCFTIKQIYKNNLIEKKIITKVQNQKKNYLKKALFIKF